MGSTAVSAKGDTYKKLLEVQHGAVESHPMNPLRCLVLCQEASASKSPETEPKRNSQTDLMFQRRRSSDPKLGLEAKTSRVSQSPATEAASSAYQQCALDHRYLHSLSLSTLVHFKRWLFQKL